MKDTNNLSRDALRRIFWIDEAITMGMFPNTEKLAKDCNVSIPTISRDIHFMKEELDAPIEYNRKKNGYYYHNKSFSIKWKSYQTHALHNFKPSKKKIHFRVEFFGEAVSQMRKHVKPDWKISEKKDSIIVNFSNTHYDKILKLVLSKGQNAFPLAPVELVNDWRTNVKNMMNRTKLLINTPKK